MAATSAKPSYDPIKAIEGMFNGSVTRIGYVFKDPAGYGANTRAVLAECAKRFQDALDDCEIQILDAKWYLEHQLAKNKLRREEKARESSTAAAAKRKLEETKEAAQNQIQASPPKKLKTEEATAASVKPEQQTQPISQSPVQQKTATEPAKAPDSRKTSPQLKKTDTPQTQTEQPAAEQKPAEPTKPPDSTLLPPSQPTDDFAKPTPHGTPTGTNDDFNFESMFGDPTMDETGNDQQFNDDMNMDLDLGLGDSLNTTDLTNTQDPNSSLTSLLPGLESYANQTSLNTNDPSAPSQAFGGDSSLPTFSNNFDLPDLGDSNTFDDFLNDDTLGNTDTNFDAGGMEGVDLTDEGFNNMSFDDMFGDL